MPELEAGAASRFGTPSRPHFRALNQMVAWMIDWCSVRATDQGFLDVDGPSVAALGGSFSLLKRDLAQHGIVPFRRTEGRESSTDAVQALPPNLRRSPPLPGLQIASGAGQC